MNVMRLSFCLCTPNSVDTILSVISLRLRHPHRDVALEPCDACSRMTAGYVGSSSSDILGNMRLEWYIS